MPIIDNWPPPGSGSGGGGASTATDLTVEPIDGYPNIVTQQDYDDELWLGFLFFLNSGMVQLANTVVHNTGEPVVIDVGGINFGDVLTIVDDGNGNKIPGWVTP